MHSSLRILAGAAILTFGTTVWADDADRPEHYQGKESATTEQALQNLSEYNAKLENILDQDELSAADLNEVHNLTYTLENALERLQIDLKDTADVLEEVHVASETNEAATVKKRGVDYLQATRKLTQ